VLMCSCFFPVYCGFIPPSYRGVLYMDGALSNNMPLFEQRNTITMAPFSGESDICPTEGTFNFFEVHYGNVSIQVNTGNVHRVCTSFLPPRLEKLAEICHNGYMDALRFLRERDLLGTQCLPPSLVSEMDAVKPSCCEPKKTLMNGLNLAKEEQCWLDQKVIENLPVDFKKILCEACRESHDGVSWWSQLAEFLPVKLVLYLLSLLMLPIELTFLLAKSVIESGCTVIYRLLTSAADFSNGGKENIRASRRYYGLTVWFPDMIKYLQKQEYSSGTKVFVKEKVEHVTFNFTLENQVHRQGEYFNDKFMNLKMKSTVFEDSLFEECYLEDITSSNTFFKNCTFIATLFYNTDLFKYKLINCKLINSTFLHNKEGCLLSDINDENNAYTVYFVSFLGTLAVLPGNIVSALLMDKIGRLRMLGRGYLVISSYLSFPPLNQALLTSIWFITSPDSCCIYTLVLHFSLRQIVRLSA
ncbi:patatin-like phospholipase domain-containing protein 2 isoform X1, partial [Lates japonicus]